MKRIRRLFFIVTITVGGCVYSSFIFSHSVQTELPRNNQNIKDVFDDPLVKYIEESVSGNFQSSADQNQPLPVRLYALLFGISNIHAHLFSRISKTFKMLAYYGIGQCMLFKEYMKRLLLRITM